ncbi:uncharacterized protein LOC136029667 [Artemia franciscana]|uniref:uncharacterized protein LOC136029667 n=1 Tax=Artemia franciscana TaxID=6661 RepID=UPI0032DA42AC
MLLKASQRGLNPCIVRSLRDMYSRLSIRLKLPPDENLPPRPYEKLIPVLKGARQGAVSSLHLFNNCVLQAQDKCPTSCILSSIDTSLVCYADDVLNLRLCMIKSLQNYENTDIHKLASTIVKHYFTNEDEEIRRRKRYEETVELKKAKKEYIVLETTDEDVLSCETLQEIVISASSSDPQIQIKAIQNAGKLLSSHENPPIDALTQSGMLPVLVNCVQIFEKYEFIYI